MKKITLIANRFIDEEDIKMEVVAVDNASRVIENVARALDNATNSYEKYNNESNKQEQSNSKLVDLYKSLLVRVQNNLNAFNGLNRSIKATSSELKKIADINATLSTKAISGKLFDFGSINENDVISMFKAATSIEKTLSDMQERLGASITKQAEDEQKAAEAAEREAIAKQKSADTISKFKENMKVIKDEMDIISSLSKQTPLRSSEINKLSNIQQMFNVDDSKINDALVEKSAKSISATKKIIMDLESRIQKTQEQQAKDAQKAAEAAEREATAREKIVNSAIHDTSKSMGKGIYSRSYKETDGQSRQENFAKLQKILDNEETAFGRLKNAITGASSEINKNSNAVNNNKKSVDSANNSWTSFGKTLTGKLVRFRIVSSALKSTASTFLQLYETAASYEEALNLYTTSLGEYATAGRKWADEISEALYLDPTSVLQYTGALYSLVQGLGVTSDAAYTMATNLTQLSYDMSSYLNIDVQSAYDKLQSAITGQSRAVATAGVALQQATLAELAHSLGIKKSVSEMTQAEKTYLRYIQIMRSTTNMQGDLAKTMITPENALRTVKTQFLLLGRAIGQVFIPIVLRAIPYVMAFTQILTELASKVSKWTGYKIADIDYSKLKLSSAAMEDLGDTADDAAGSINRTLAAFDDLNVVESESSKKGKDNSSVIGDLEEYITGYDMLKNLTGDFEKNVKTAKEQLEDLWDVLKLIGITIGVLKFAKLITGFRDSYVAGTGLSGVLSRMVKRFKEGYASVGKHAKGIDALKAGFQNILTPAQKVIGVIGGTAISFGGAYSIMKDTDFTVDSLTKHILGSAGLVVGLTGIATVLTGPIGGAIVGLGGLIGGLIGYYVSWKEEVERLKTEQVYLNLAMDNAGTSIKDLPDEMDNLFSKYTTYADNTKLLSDRVKDSEDSFKKATTEADNLEAELLSQTYDDYVTEIQKLKDSNDALKTNYENLNNAEKDAFIAQLDRLYQESAITIEEYKKRKQAITEAYDAETARAKGYYDKFLEIQEEYGKTGDLETYNEKVKNLRDQYSDVTDTIDTTTDKFANMSGVLIDTISLSGVTADEINSSVESLGDSWESYRKSITDTYNTEKEQNDAKIAHYAKILASLEGNTDASEEYRNQIQAAYDALIAQNETLTDEYKNNLGTIDATFSDTLQTIWQKLVDNGAASTKEFEGVFDTLESRLKQIGDVDMSKSAANFMDNYMAEMYVASRATHVETRIAKDGSLVTGYFIDGSLQMIKDNKGNIIASTYDMGEMLLEGFENGIGDKVYQERVKKKMKELDTAIENVNRDQLGIHSPSALTESFGINLIEGFTKGLGDNEAMYGLKKSVNNLTTSISDEISKKVIKLNIDTNVESSFNSLLTKLQSFCDKWRTAVNTLVSSTSNLMSSLKIASNGKLSYTSMPKINVQRFDDGGYPKSGDYFFANENGVPEYITSIGNRSAVVNQDQMVSALSNAIIVGMSRLPSNNPQPGNTIVYIGNDKVYEGQGTYQSRQADRYGTNYIKI